MTSVETTPAPPTPPEPAEAQTPSKTSQFGAWIDGLTFRTAEFLNPILIKEGRQALKSRGFSVPFLLVLVACLFWSFLGVAIFDDIYHGAVGWDFFFGYFTILCFPMMVVVPFGAFRSLTGEREDGTYEMLSITTLRPLQIVNGKLGSAMMQMVVYLSAVAPCIAFTYLLRGIDLIAIVVVLFWVICASVLLSVICLMLATMASTRHWQMLLTVAVIAALVFTFIFTITLVIEEGDLERVRWGVAIESWEFWMGNCAVLSAVLMIGLLAYTVAQAQLKFPTDNRSTAVRIVMVLCGAVFTAWIGWATWTFAEEIGLFIQPVFYTSFLYFGFWFVMGSFLIGEYGELSRRIRRTLPQTFLGRMVTTWFIPGSGTGYMFAVCCGFAGAVMGLTAAWYADLQLPNTVGGFFRIDNHQLQQALIYQPIYLAFYLGIGRLVVLFLRRHMQVGVVAALLLNLVILAVICLVPLAIQATAMQSQLQDDQLTLVAQMADPFLVLGYVHEDKVSAGMMMLHVVILGGVTVLIFFLNLPSIVREVRQQRVAEPKRVREERAAQQGPAPEPAPTNPFDD